MSAPIDLIHYNSRLGIMPSYNTLYGYLEKFADEDAKAVRDHGSDPETAGTIWLDNVQNYSSPGDAQFGRQSQLISGLAATYVEGVDYEVSAFDLTEKHRLLEENKRKDLTVDELLWFIDWKHREEVGSFHFLRVLVEHIPELAQYTTKVSDLFRTRGAGQTSDRRDPRLILVGGDGLTYEKLLQLKNYLGFEKDDNAVESLDIVEPILAYESTLGHSANKIGRKTPSNLSKVDYKDGMEILFTVLDARILDCFRVYWNVPNLFEYFTQLAESPDGIPSLEQLEEVALRLYRAYATSRGYERAMHEQSDRDQNTALSGDASGKSPSTWVSPLSDMPSTASGPKPHKAPRSKARGTRGQPAPSTTTPAACAPDTANTTETPFAVNAFIRDVVVLREFALKVMVFTFAGSTHTKYTAYLLEMICNLELESTPALRHAILSNLVVNLTGNEGSFQPGDLMQEYFNRLLEAVAEKKGVEYGDHFVRHIISRNLHHFASLLNDLKGGVGLQRRSGRHTTPQKQPEFKILAGIYQDCELHSRRRGREYPGVARDVDDFRKGYEKLQDGKMKKWIAESMFLRSVRVPTGAKTTPSDALHPASAEQTSNTTTSPRGAASAESLAAKDDSDDSESESDHDSESESDDSDEEEATGDEGGVRQSLASACMHHGQLVFEVFEVQAEEIDRLLGEQDEQVDETEEGCEDEASEEGEAEGDTGSDDDDE
ncbi:uncharacterized protein B0H18DRAFT_1062212 [Fomitopsis serialis]|uniref:uncharacterized protein n=1 Tax=Fomitopsis serialis TaxID=139415 RepID=UPI002007F519|nr:uncharacterized protein B0H18DRAFT_1062212 [Neoantrodia serialis]KAH9911496.1 hypothetical protein B0H18DRAFT_1062212 [Neoantrodia serialis]